MKKSELVLVGVLVAAAAVAAFAASWNTNSSKFTSFEDTVFVYKTDMGGSVGKLDRVNGSITFLDKANQEIRLDVKDVDDSNLLDNFYFIKEGYYITQKENENRLLILLELTEIGIKNGSPVKVKSMESNLYIHQSEIVIRCIDRYPIILEYTNKKDETDEIIENTKWKINRKNRRIEYKIDTEIIFIYPMETELKAGRRSRAKKSCKRRRRA
jgi:hypothetical protein